MAEGPSVTACSFCGSPEERRVHTYPAPPEGEVQFPLGDGTYERDLWQCDGCGHVRSRHSMDMRALYESAYVDATYGADGLRAAYERVLALPPERSDNAARCARVDAYARARRAAPDAGGGLTLLDVGAGLGVFPHGMHARGWRVTALDPDPRAVRHIAQTVGVTAVQGDFLAAEADSLGRFDLVSFNKVLEHVTDPCAMLRRSRHVLAAGGVVYVELPDAEGAADAGYGREEFFIEHHHVFSAASVALLAWRAGLRLDDLGRLHEPSGKFTLAAFMTEAAP